jgi:mitotic spindle assembly checkpoint protein MAD2
MTLLVGVSFAGIYTPDMFKRETKYGLTVLTTTDEGLLRYLRNVQGQVSEWLVRGHVKRLVLVVQGVDTLETLERWQFNVSVDDSDKSHAVHSSNSENVRSVANSSRLIEATDSSDKKSNEDKMVGTKSVREIHKEIQSIIRQITASVTFLPLLQEACTFDLLVYTDHDMEVPEKWSDSDPCYILNSSEVKLRSFTTSVHKIDSMVAYREAEEWEL